MSELRMMGRKAETGRCIFCGKVGTWWECGCEWGEGIRAGKLLKPRTVVRGGVPVIELCDELRGAARSAGVITREYEGEVLEPEAAETLGNTCERVVESVGRGQVPEANSLEDKEE